MRRDLLEALSRPGDPTLLLLGGLAVFFHLWSSDERRRLAGAWAAAFGLCVVLTVASKFAFHLVGADSLSPLRLLSPSGHVSIATGFYGGCAMMLVADCSRSARVLTYVGTAMLLGMLAVVRIMQGLHSVPEIAAAFAIGIFCIVLFGSHLRNGPPVMVDRGHLVSLLALIGVAHYSRVDGESLIRNIVQKVYYLRGEAASLTEHHFPPSGR